MTHFLLDHLNLWSRCISRRMMLRWFLNPTSCIKYLNWIFSLICRRSYHILPLICFESISGLGRRYHHHCLGRRSILWGRIMSRVVFTRESENTVGGLVRSECSRCLLDTCLFRWFRTISLAFNHCGIFLSLRDIKHHICVNRAHMPTVLVAGGTTGPSATSQGHSLL